MRKILLLLFTISAAVVAGQDIPLPDSVISHYHSLPANKRSAYLQNYLASFSTDSSGINKLLKIQPYFKK